MLKGPSKMGIHHLSIAPFPVRAEHAQGTDLERRFLLTPPRNTLKKAHFPVRFSLRRSPAPARTGRGSRRRSPRRSALKDAPMTYAAARRTRRRRRACDHIRHVDRPDECQFFRHRRRLNPRSRALTRCAGKSLATPAAVGSARSPVGSRRPDLAIRFGIARGLSCF